MCYTTHINNRRVVCKEKSHGMKMERSTGSVPLAGSGCPVMNTIAIVEPPINSKDSAKHVISKAIYEHATRQIQTESTVNTCAGHDRAIQQNSGAGIGRHHARGRRTARQWLGQLLMLLCDQGKLSDRLTARSAARCVGSQRTTMIIQGHCK